MRRTRKGLKRDIAWGMIGGAALAGYYTLVAGLIYLFKGAAPFAASGVSFIGTLAAYWAGGLIGGIVVGVLAPYARNRLGAMGIGILVAFPACVAISLVASGTLHLGAVLIMSIVFGAWGGFVLASLGGPSMREIAELEATVDDVANGKLHDDDLKERIRSLNEKRGT